MFVKLFYFWFQLSLFRRDILCFFNLNSSPFLHCGTLITDLTMYFFCNYVIFFCGAISSIRQRLKHLNECLRHNSQISIHYLTVSVSQEFKSCLVIGFWLRVSYEVVVKMSAGAEVTWSPTRAGGSEVIHSHIWLLMLIVGRNSVSHYTGLSSSSLSAPLHGS